MQNVEAMLCAYVEGDLDAAGRAEIEKHLQEHPQHRKLLDDLMASRKLLKDLPHVKVPGEVDDSLRGQTERSILLDDSKNLVAATGLGDSRWGRSFALAAVILLCLALAMIVYKTLGPTNKPNKVITQVTPLPPTPAEETPEAKPTDRKAMDSVQTNTAPAAAAPELGTPQQQQQQVQQNAPGQETSAVVMVVHSADPTSAALRLADWLRSQNDLKWTFVPAMGFSNSASNNMSANGNADLAARYQLAFAQKATTDPSTAPTDLAITAAPEGAIAATPPVPPSAIAGRDQYWIHGVTQQELDAVAVALNAQFNAPVDKYAASVIAIPNSTSAEIYKMAQAKSELADATKDLAATQPATDGLQVTGGMGGGGGFGGGRSAGGFGMAAANANADRGAAPATMPDQPKLLDAIIVLAPLAPPDAAVSSPATMPSSQPTNFAAPTTLPGS